MRILLLACLILVGCGTYEIEHENSSTNTSSNWAQTYYPSQCEWLGFGRVVDGDTVIVFGEAGQVRVRMIGIDTPESKKEGTPIQAHALEATRELKKMIGNPLQVCLIQDRIGDQVDIYDRRLSYVFTAEGLDLNAEMLRLGWAKAYRRFPFDRKTEFARLEVEAKQAKVGRWK